MHTPPLIYRNEFLLLFVPPSLIMTLALKTSKQLQKQHQTAYWSRRNTHSLSDTLWPSSSRQEMRIATTKNCIFGFLVRDHQDDGGWPFNVVWHTGEKYDDNLIHKMILFLIFLDKQYVFWENYYFIHFWNLQKPAHIKLYLFL